MNEPENTITAAQAQATFDAMALVTDAIAGDAFADELLLLLESLASVDSLAAVFFPVSGRPQLLFERTRQGVVGKQASMAHYLEGAYLLDPFYKHCQRELESGFYRLADLAPDNFFQSAYFQQYYRFANFADECGFLLRQPKADAELSGYIHLSLASGHGFTEDSLAALASMAAWFLAVMKMHWRGLGVSSDNGLHRQLQQAFDNFGRSLLTQREAEIAHLLLHGHSTRSMADRLAISTETIKVHKRHLYQKLDIGSQSELFSLFLQALAHANEVDDSDPLALLNSRL